MYNRFNNFAQRISLAKLQRYLRTDPGARETGDMCVLRRSVISTEVVGVSDPLDLCPLVRV